MLSFIVKHDRKSFHSELDKEKFVELTRHKLAEFYGLSALPDIIGQFRILYIPHLGFSLRCMDGRWFIGTEYEYADREADGVRRSVFDMVNALGAEEAWYTDGDMDAAPAVHDSFSDLKEELATMREMLASAGIGHAVINETSFVSGRVARILVRGVPFLFDFGRRTTIFDKPLLSLPVFISGNTFIIELAGGTILYDFGTGRTIAVEKRSNVVWDGDFWMDNDWRVRMFFEEMEALPDGDGGRVCLWRVRVDETETEVGGFVQTASVDFCDSEGDVLHSFTEPPEEDIDSYFESD